MGEVVTGVVVRWRSWGGWEEGGQCTRGKKRQRTRSVFPRILSFRQGTPGPGNLNPDPPFSSVFDVLSRMGLDANLLGGCDRGIFKGHHSGRPRERDLRDSWAQLGLKYSARRKENQMKLYEKSPPRSSPANLLSLPHSLSLSLSLFLLHLSPPPSPLLLLRLPKL